MMRGSEENSGPTRINIRSTILPRGYKRNKFETNRCPNKVGVFGAAAQTAAQTTFGRELYLRKSLNLWCTHQELNLEPSDP